MKMTGNLRALAIIFASIACFSAPVSADNVTLCYHKFSTSLDDLYTVMPEMFRWQMRYIKSRNINIIPLSTLTDYYDGKDGGIGNNVLVTIDDGWKSVNRIIPVLKDENIPAALYIYPQVIRSDDKEYLNEKEVKLIAKSGLIEFGCHSYTHPVLTREDGMGLKHEIVDCKAELIKMFGGTFDTYAYPFGMLNKRIKKFASEHYRAAFGVNDGSNKPGSDRFNLNRNVIYKNTTFGEFEDIVSRAEGSDISERPYVLKFMGEEKDSRYFQFTKVRLYKYPKEPRKKTILIVPSSTIGAAWIYRLKDSLVASGWQVYMMVQRNNNIPFYREGEIEKVVKTWGIDKFRGDLAASLDYIVRENGNVTVITWGDGFDMLMSQLCTGQYANNINGILAINPSIFGNDGTKDFFAGNIRMYQGKLNKRQYLAGDLKYFLKIKTLTDLMVLDPEAISPFSKKLGLGKVSNKDALAMTLDSVDHPELGIKYEDEGYTMEDFKLAFMQPVPVFSMVLPVAFLKDINMMWVNAFVDPSLGLKGASLIKCKAAFFYTDAYEKGVKATKNMFTGLRVVAERSYNDESTIELMLSKDAVSSAADVINSGLSQ